MTITPTQADQDEVTGIGTPYSIGCWHWFSGAWSDPIEHDGSGEMPSALDASEPVLIAYNPIACQMAETWGAALSRGKAAGERDWAGVTAYRRLRSAIRAKKEGLE